MLFSLSFLLYLIALFLVIYCYFNTSTIDISIVEMSKEFSKVHRAAKDMEDRNISLRKVVDYVAKAWNGGQLAHEEV